MIVFRATKVFTYFIGCKGTTFFASKCVKIDANITHKRKKAPEDAFCFEYLFANGDNLPSNDHLRVFGLVTSEPFEESLV